MKPAAGQRHTPERRAVQGRRSSALESSTPNASTAHAAEPTSALETRMMLNTSSLPLPTKAKKPVASSNSNENWQSRSISRRNGFYRNSCWSSAGAADRSPPSGLEFEKPSGEHFSLLREKKKAHSTASRARLCHGTWSNDRSATLNTAPAGENGGDDRITPVGHRSRATQSRQPRQVRKEATVTG